MGIRRTFYVTLGYVRLDQVRRPVALAALLAWSLVAADWLNEGGDAQHTRWQKHEKILNPSNVSGLKLIWKRKLPNESKGANALTAPTILGHLITHRGTRELVIIGGSSDNVFAVDADLGTLFWQKHLDAAAPACGGEMTAAPAITPAPLGTEDLEDDDAPQVLRPVYIVASDGKVHALRPSDGEDLSPPLPFLPPGAKAFGLTFAGSILHAATSKGCGVPEGNWSIDVTVRDSKPTFERTSGAARDQTATYDEAGGARWIYAASRTGIDAFKVSGNTRTHVWTSRPMPSPLAPVVANGIVYALSRTTLYALDAATGRELYSSGDQIGPPADSSGLAVANGHVCFGTQDNTLYCFGFPIDR